MGLHHKNTCEICGLRSPGLVDQKRIFMAKFPLDADRCRQWVKLTGKEDLVYIPIEKLNQLKQICANHFRPKDFNKKKNRLKRNAVPSLLITAEPLSDEILVGFPLHMYNVNKIKNQHSPIEPSKSIKDTNDLKTETSEIPSSSAPASPTLHDSDHDSEPPTIETPTNESPTQVISIVSMDNTSKQSTDSSSKKMRYITLTSHEQTKLMSKDDTEETNSAETNFSIYKVCHACLKFDNTAIIGPNLRATYYALCGAGAPLPVLCRKCLQMLVNADKFSAECVKGFQVIKKLMDNNMMIQKAPERKIIAVPLLPRPRRIQLSVKRFTPDYYDECVIEEMNEEPIENFEEPYIESESDNFVTETILENYSEQDPIEVKTEEKLENVNEDEEVDQEEIEDKFQKHFTIQKLTFEEQLSELWEKQHRDRYKEALFKCTTCFTPFNDEKKFNVHMFSHSEEAGDKECKVCHKRFRSSKYLYSHKRRHEYKYRCKLCPVVAFSNTANEHIKFHKGTLYHCEKCDAQFKGKSTYMFHMKSKHSDPKSVCPFCGLSFVNTIGLRAHYRITLCAYNKQIPPDGPFCDVCSIQFISEEAYKTHLKVSPQHATSLALETTPKPRRPKPPIQRVRHAMRATQFDKPLPCEPCGVAFTGLTEYLNHKRKFHPEEYTLNVDRKVPLICDICGKILTNATYLRCHILQHQGVKFKCNICDRVYKSYISLSVHRATHSGKKHICKICSKPFSSAGNRFKHMDAVHGTAEHITCAYCNKSFKVKEHILQHMRHVHFKQPWPKRKRHPYRNDKPEDQKEIEQVVKEQYIEPQYVPKVEEEYVDHIYKEPQYVPKECIEEEYIDQNVVEEEYIEEMDVWNFAC